jgi:hypothetical protein
MAAPYKLRALKNLQLFVEFPFIFLSNLKFIECRKSFLFKFLFFCSLDPAARDGRTTRPTLATPLTVSILVMYCVLLLDDRLNVF